MHGPPRRLVGKRPTNGGGTPVRRYNRRSRNCPDAPRSTHPSLFTPSLLHNFSERLLRRGGHPQSRLDSRGQRYEPSGRGAARQTLEDQGRVGALPIRTARAARFHAAGAARFGGARRRFPLGMLERRGVRLRGARRGVLRSQAGAGRIGRGAAQAAWRADVFLQARPGPLSRRAGGGAESGAGERRAQEA